MIDLTVSTSAKPRAFDAILAKLLGPWIEHYQRVLTFG